MNRHDTMPFSRLRLKFNESWLLFFACIFIYSFKSNSPFLNGQILITPDTTTNSLLAFNWLFNGRLDFDNFRAGAYYTYYNSDGQPPYFFWEANSGHLAPIYPIGTAIVSFPIFVCFALFLWISQGFHSVDLTSAAFFSQRFFFERIAAAVIASFSVVLFYQLSRIKFERSIALVTSFIYAFATNVWAINSQALWQHGATNLVLIAVLLCLFKANRAPAATQLLLLNAGILSGFLIGIRLTNLAFVLPIVLYTVSIYRRRSVFLFLGLSSCLIHVGWSFYHFKNFTGGYGTFENLYWISIEQFIAGFTGLLFSPNRGLLVYTPIVLLAIPGLMQISRQWRYKEEKLLILLLIGCVPLFLQYCFFRIWWGAAAYGPRFLTDTLPILCFAMNYAIAQYFDKHTLAQSLRDFKFWITSSLLVFSVGVQVVGILGYNPWEFVPTAVIPYNPHATGLSIEAEQKGWQLRDGQIERSLRTLLFRLDPPTRQPNYTAGLAGKILLLRDEQKRSFSKQVLIQPGGSLLRVYATVQNTGISQWYGYQTGAAHLGEARVRVVVLDVQGKAISEARLYIPGQPKAGEAAIALGDIPIPLQSGRYTITFNLIADGMWSLPLQPNKTERSMAAIKIQVPGNDRGI